MGRLNTDTLTSLIRLQEKMILTLKVQIVYRS